MEYKLRSGEDVIPFNVDKGDEGRMSIACDGQTMEIQSSRISANHFHLNVGGRNINAYVSADGSGKTVIIKGVPYYLEDADLQPAVKKSARGAAPTTVTPPMPAVVVSVNASVGETVKEGQPLVVVSAMKMETTLTAPYGGLVTAVNAAPGDKVMPGQILVDIQKEES